MRRGWYVKRADWGDARQEQRHLLSVMAAEQTAVTERVYSHRTAAALHGLPAWSGWSHGDGGVGVCDELRVHAYFRQGSKDASSRLLIRHHGKLDENDVVVVAGMRVTSVERTIYDLAVSESLAVALACADQYVHSLAADRRAIDAAAWERWRERLRARARRASGEHGARGVRAVRAVAALADPRAETVLESVSRLRALQAGLDLELQVPVRAEGKGTLYLDHAR